MTPPEPQPTRFDLQLLVTFVDLEETRNSYWIGGGRLRGAAGRNWKSVQRLLAAGLLKRRRKPHGLLRAAGNTVFIAGGVSFDQWEYRVTEPGYTALDEAFPGWDDSSRSQDPPGQNDESDVVAQLKDLASLRDSGALSPEEFEALKRKLLD